LTGVNLIFGKVLQFLKGGAEVIEVDGSFLVHLVSLYSELLRFFSAALRYADGLREDEEVWRAFLAVLERVFGKPVGRSVLRLGTGFALPALVKRGSGFVRAFVEYEYYPDGFERKVHLEGTEEFESLSRRFAGEGLSAEPLFIYTG